MTRRNSVSPEEYHRTNQQVCDHVAMHPAFVNAHVVGSYMAHNNEINPAALTSAFLNKTWAFPRVEPTHTLTFVTHHPHQALNKNRYGILEPSGDETIALESIDVLLMPLLAFDQRGHRLGFGAGYYDRSLANNSKHPFLIGLAYTWQEVAQIPNDPWDITLDDVVRI